MNSLSHSNETRTKEPNQSLEPTRMLVTDPAYAGSAPSIRAAHLKRSAKKMNTLTVLILVFAGLAVLSFAMVAEDRRLKESRQGWRLRAAKFGSWIYEHGCPVMSS